MGSFVRFILSAQKKCGLRHEAHFETSLGTRSPGKGMVEPMNQYLENIRENSGRARDSVLEFNGLWHGECYRDWFDSEVEK